MPHSVNGIGTRFYGKRDRDPDGSYVTTMWFTFLYLPILPLGSFRVLPVGEATNFIIKRSQQYRSSKIPLCWPQIRNVYLTISPVIFLIAHAIWKQSRQ
ncbi:MAG TPA: hypothetical protein VGS27_21320 [Candidatus Sulfotelmatobacter sp.]|nr:hypothetical protein [Candidatus Sulfotelmatobacter sp.]